MSRIIATVLATGAVLGLAATAQAGGPARPAAEPPVALPVQPLPAANPVSRWTGAYAGGALGYADLNGTGTLLDGKGGTGGVFAGYRLSFGQVVAGAEVSYDAGRFGLGTAGDKFDHMAKLKLSAGYDLGNTLIYVAGGPVRAKTTVGGASLSDTGYFLGVGADYALDNHWSLGGEIDGNRFKNFGGTGNNLTATTVEARVSYRF